MKKVESIVRELRDAKDDIEDRSTISDYLGVNIIYQDDQTLELTQPQLI